MPAAVPAPDAGHGPNLTRRNALRIGAGGGLAMMAAFGTSGGLAQAAAANGWRHYPFSLFPGDPAFDFPSAEGVKSDHGTDTWYADGKLTSTSGREFAFIVIFCKNRVGGPLRADFYTFAVFDLQTGDYGTFTEYDFPPANLVSAAKFSGAPDHLDLRFSTTQGPASWSTRRNRLGALVPFGYRLNLVGKDRQQRPMGLRATLDPANPPTVVGQGRGTIECFGQTNTGTYFQTGPRISGVLSWGDIRETVTGRIGHVDRQWFPGSAFSKVGITARGISHEWRSVNLDDGSDLSLWRQFDRAQHNQVIPFTGSTRFIPDGPDARDGAGRTDFTPDLEITYRSYVKWPASIETFVPAPSAARYSPSAHRLRIAEWDLELEATPLVPVPAHQLPVEYMIGPMAYRGTLAGAPISGFGVSERTLCLYRDWELAQVLRTTITNLPGAALAAALVGQGVSRAGLLAMVTSVDGAVARGDRLQVIHLVATQLGPAVKALAEPHRGFLATLLNDLLTAPSS